MNPRDQVYNPVSNWTKPTNRNEGRKLEERQKRRFPVCLSETVRDTFLVDPAVILIVVGVVMFFITFCGCIGALRENIRLLKTVKVQPSRLLKLQLML